MAYDYNRTAGTGDMDKSLKEALDWIDRLEDKLKKAKAELKSRKEPGRATAELVGQAVRTGDEDWYHHWFR